MSDQFDSRQIKAVRKAHQCYGCLEMIAVGEPAQYQRGVNDGNFWTIYFCGGCQQVMKEHDFWEVFEDGCMPGDVRDYAEGLVYRHVGATGVQVVPELKAPDA